MNDENLIRAVDLSKGYGEQHRIEVLRLLQGEVFDRKEVPVLDAMRKYIRMVEETPGHAFAPMLSDMPI